MADMSVFDIPSSAAVSSAVREQRTQGLTSPSGAQVRRTATQVALDSLFGNPMVNKAKQMENLVKQGDDDAERQFADEGITDPTTKQMLRLEAIRNRVKDVNPNLALKLEDQIRQLRVADLERKKLSQTVQAGDQQLRDITTRYVFNPDTLQTEVIDISTAEGKARLDEAGRSGWAISDKPGGILNIFSAERAGRRNWALEQKKLDAKAELEEKKLENQGVFAITDTRKTQLQAAHNNSQMLRDRYRRVADVMNDPNMLTLANRVGNMTIKGVDKLGADVPAETRQQYRDFVTMAASAMDAANVLIKERSGAAVTGQEWERLKVVVPLVTDSPQEFMAKLQEFYTVLGRAQRRIESAFEGNDFRILGQDSVKWASEQDALFRSPTERAKAEAQAAPAATPTTGEIKFMGFE